MFDWDSDGTMSPWTIADSESVDERRAAVGLPPLALAIARVRREAAEEGNRPPPDFADRQQQIQRWARQVGWI